MSPRLNSDTTLPSPTLDSVHEEEYFPLANHSPRKTTRSMSHSDAAHPTSLAERPSSAPLLLKEETVSPSRPKHHRTTSLQTFQSQERASLLFRIEELEQALKEAKEKKEEMAREREELLCQVELSHLPQSRNEAMDDSYQENVPVGGSSADGASVPVTSDDAQPFEYPSPPGSPPSPRPFFGVNTLGLDPSDTSTEPRPSHLVKSLIKKVPRAYPRVMVTSPTLNLAMNNDGMSDVLGDDDALDFFASPTHSREDDVML